MATVQEEIQEEKKAFSQLDKIKQLPMQKKLGLMVAAAAVIAMTAGTWLWSQTPDYRVLYTNVSDQEGGTIIDALQKMNIPYQFSESGGSILIPASQVHEVRLRLAGQGLPKGSLSGFEILENQKFGSSQFLEQVNYQRALEGELSRSIQSLSAVQGARVHLAIARPSVFTRERPQPRVSVLLNLHPGRMLSAEQVSAIVHLVSSSIPDLPVKNVTVIDQQGNLLSGQKDNQAETGLDPSQLKYVQDMEQNFIRRIEAILTPITGQDNVHAQVTADVDFSHIERAEETYRPNNNPAEAAAVRSQQQSESISISQPEGGVPGALSNRPPAPAEAPVEAKQSSEAAAKTTPTDTRKESTTNYEVDKTVAHIRQSTGRINRLSAAVVINHRTKLDAEGNPVSEPLADEEIAKLTALVKQAIGFDEKRGDTLTVTSSQFNPKGDTAEDLPLWKDPDTVQLTKDIGKQLLIAALVLFFLLKIFRPFLRNLLPPPPPPPVPALASAGNNVVQGETMIETTKVVTLEENLEKARLLAANEPAIVANVVKGWISGNGQ
ncbi:flagellar basal-body MS-ring/collar protein FliF [Nitrosomonas sp.]|uniref:flagellar basal-body MS-ring/collar protein FliF n=1 Tax=Nitrosomonas sp. TaxID=42353 RepID=UPI0025E9B682|nr:flagellar basal-body MS-ring/collar protein FliF [Nitrosomonas sp.]